MKRFFKKGLTFVLAVAMFLSSVSLEAFATENTAKSAKATSASKVNVPEGRVYITSKKYNLVPGATETVLTTNNVSGTDQKIGFIMKFDADALKDGSIKAVATYKDYEYDGVNFGMQTVLDQAKAYEKKNDGKVIAGINASFYNLNTGEPSGVFVMDGKVCKEANGQPYIAILKDGSAVIRTSKDLSDVQDAVAGDMQIVTDGQVTVTEGDYQTLQYSRCAIGITENGDIITYTTHGVSAPTSCGETYVDVAKNLIAAGCVQAINVDGGGSATSISLREGEDALTVKNKPSDGTPRTVSTSVLFVSTKKSDGVFDHAALEPNNEYYTPSTAGFLGLNKNLTKVQFTATGIDGSGAGCDLPAGLTWSVSEESKEMGKIDPETGIFTAEVDAIGEVTVNLLNGTEVVGTTNIVLAEPEEIAFSGTGVSLDFSEKTDFGLTVKGQGVALNYKDGDFEWTMDNDALGTMEGNLFTAAPKQDSSIEGNVTASYKKADGTTISESIFVEVGKMPIVELDFEDISGPRGKEVVASWDWGGAASQFNDGSPDQVYEFKDYDILYYLQSTTYSGDGQWINETYETVQPWTENEDGTVTLSFEGKEYIGSKEPTYGLHGEKWVSFKDDTGAGYYWRGFVDGDTWSGNYNAGGGSAPAILGADGYQLYAWHNAANLTTISSGNYQGKGSKIVDASEGEVRFGERALKLTYDFNNFNPIGGSKNTSIYYRTTKAIKASGTPTGYGMWVYAPEGMPNYWLWATFTYWNGTQWNNQTLHFKPVGAEKTCQYTGINWNGWTYVEVDLTPLYDTYKAVVDEEHPIQVRAGQGFVQITYIPGGSSDGEGNAIVMGAKTKGEFYIDNVRWVYGTNVDDMDSPQIISVKANDTALSLEETTEIITNDIVFDVNYTDPQGENCSGIDVQATQIYLDGSPLSNTVDYSASADRAQTVNMKLANGEHALMVSICDNFGNKTEQTYHFVVGNEDSEIPSISIARDEEAELGGNYVVKISADRLSDIETVNTSIIYGNTEGFETNKYLDGNTFYDDYGNALTLGSDGQYYDANGTLIEEPIRTGASGYYKVSNAVQTLGENLTGKIRNKTLDSKTRGFTADATVNESVNTDGTILTFTLPIPSNLTEDVKLPISVTVTYTTVDGGKYTITTGDMNKDIYAYYTVEPGIQVAGADAGVLNITTADGEKVAADTVKVYDGTIEVEGTFADNTFSTAYFVGKEAGYNTKKVVVADAANKHYSYATPVSVSEGAAAKEEILHFDVALHATSKDSTTSEEITWLSAYEAGTEVMAQYVTKAAYNAVAEGEDPFANAESVVGTSVLRNFATEGKAARVNTVEITNLRPGTTYVFRVGDGTNWSKVGEFKTMDSSGATKFMVMGDVQLGSSMSEEEKAYFQGIGEATKDVDFGLQTGDFTDNPDSYVEWDNILQTWSDEFAGRDFVRVIGNHEVYGTGAGNSRAILGIEPSQPHYYSVEYGEVYVAVINQTADLNEAAAWLIEDAAKTDCTWKVLTCHQPIYFSNPNGSSDGHHKVLKVACDAAGIDFTFSGHDHSYVRTKQQKDGVALDFETDEKTNAYVDADGNYVATKGDGTVYYICGDLGEKSREDGYKIVNNPKFNFAVATQDYDALYITAEADENKIILNTWNLDSKGAASLLDTFTMYTDAGICVEAGTHVIPQDEVKYNAETGKLICDRCGEEVDPAEITYTGFAVDMDGADEYGDIQYYFLAGNVRTGFFAFGEDIYYANEVGLIDHLTENKNTNTCTENGNRTAYSPRYDEKYVGGKVPFTGHSYETLEDDSLKCTTCGHVAIDIADWEFSLSYTSTNYTGTYKYPAVNIVNPETGEKLEYATDGMGKLTDYTRVWSNNKNVGTATVLVEANPESDYTNSKGGVTLSLRINPPLPTSVTVDSTTSTTATLSWDEVKQADSYRVYKKVNSAWSLVGETEETSYVVTDLNAQSEYEFAIRSYAEVDNSLYISNGYAMTEKATTADGIDISDASVKLSYTKTTYNGNAKAPTPTVVLDGVTLVRNTDYEVTRINNVNAGTATVIVTGVGNYAGETRVNFTIAPQKLAGATVKAEEAVYDGSNTTTSVSVEDAKGLALKENVDYTLEYLNNSSVGLATVKVVGKGNYTGTVVGEFKIVQKNISNLDATVDKDAELVFTGLEIKPEINVGKLVEGTDYTVSYEDNINVGKAIAIVEGTGNYTGSTKVTYEILARDIATVVVTDGTVYTYTGKEVEADINVVDDLGTAMILDADYKVSQYMNNVKVGTASVVIEGLGNYTGTYTHEYEIKNANVAGFTVSLTPDTYVYSGGYRKPAVTVINDADVELVENIDYTVAYENNKNAGTATVVVTGIGNYEGTVSRNFTIEKADIEDTVITLSYTKTTFTGGKKIPTVVVKTAKGTTLKKGTNYTVSYENNKNAGIATVVVTGVNNYGGVKKLNFTIKPAQLPDKCTVSMLDNTYYADGNEKTPTMTVVTKNGTTLKEGVSYKVEYQDNINAGEAKAIVTGIGNYAGSVVKTFKIEECIDLSGFSASLSYTVGNYTGSEKTPTVSVMTAKGTKLALNKNYTVSYSNNIEVGTGTVTIKGIGKYTGTITKTFTIRPPKPTNLAVVNTTTTTVKVSFERNEVADKYYIYVDGKYVGCAATVDYYTIKNLKTGTAYDVTVKAVSVVNGKNIYSTSSSVLEVTTK